ncbi:MAG: PaaI family thioesterase [Desulforhopalus sp.]
MVHGGVISISTILDETMSWAAIFLLKRFILTKQMTIQFHRPVYVGSSLSGIGSIKERIRECKAIIKAELFDDKGELRASSEGEFVLNTKEQFTKMEIIPVEELQAMATSFEDA